MGFSNVVTNNIFYKYEGLADRSFGRLIPWNMKNNDTYYVKTLVENYKKMFYELDISNCYLSILENLCSRHGIFTKYLKEFNETSGKIESKCDVFTYIFGLESPDVSSKSAVTTFGQAKGDYTTYDDDNLKENTLYELRLEIGHLANQLYNIPEYAVIRHFADLEMTAKPEDVSYMHKYKAYISPQFKFLALLLETMESNIILFLVNVLRCNDITVELIVCDGIFVGTEDKVSVEYLERKIKDSFNFNIKVKMKKYSEDSYTEEHSCCG